MIFADLRFDVTAAVPESVSGGGRLHIEAWLFAPDAGDLPERPLVIACLAGGTYDRRYYHIEIPGHPGYSMAEYLARRGSVVLVLDHLGIGDSSRPAVQSLLTRDVVAAANRAALQQAYEKLTVGRLAPGLPAIADFARIGVGHSLGAMQTVTQQARYGTYDRICVLGYTAVGVHHDVNGRKVPADSAAVAANPADYVLADRTPLRSVFHWDDVPEAVIRADDALNVPTPNLLGVQSISQGIIAEDAAKVTAPVFICLGERDVSPDPHAEPACFGASNDVSLLILPRSAHCQNFASTRHIMWDRIQRWSETPTERTCA
jgi:alpha-beta hydrolase superfamily lysophospholipase